MKRVPPSAPLSLSVAGLAVSTDMLTIKEALREARQTLYSSESADLDAQLLLAQLLSVERVYLLAHGEDALGETQIRDYQALLHRRAAGEPIAYITGNKWFYDLELMVTPAVLIPRPETELLLEEALRLMAQLPECQAADIGTGSGALAVAFARHQPGSRVFATDISADALCVARKNAGRYGASIERRAGGCVRAPSARKSRLSCSAIWPIPSWNAASSSIC